MLAVSFHTAPMAAAANHRKLVYIVTVSIFSNKDSKLSHFTRIYEGFLASHSKHEFEAITALNRF